MNTVSKNPKNRVKKIISIEVAGRTYSINADSKEAEERIRKAGNLINENLLVIKHRFSDKDVQDQLALVALKFANKTIELTTEESDDWEEINDDDWEDDNADENDENLCEDDDDDDWDDFDDDDENTEARTFEEICADFGVIPANTRHKTVSNP